MSIRSLEPTAPAPLRPSARRRQRTDVWAIHGFAALFVGSLLFAVVGRVAEVEALALIGGYGVLFFGVGGAPFQLCPNLGLSARLTGSVLVGFSILLAAGALMADVNGLWNPALAAAIVGAPATLLHVVGVRRSGGAARRHASTTTSVRRVERPVWRVVWALSPPARASLVLTGVGTVLWLAPALWTREPNPGYWGMLTTISPLWYAGLVLVLLSFALGRRFDLSAAASALSFGLATTLTPALVYGAPREQTAGKQMLLTQYVLTHHHMHVTAGIYQAFSAMFSGMAALSELLGVHGLLGGMSLFGVATFWPVLLVFMRVAELRFLTGRVLGTTTRRWCAVMLVLLVDSLGADYYSPQSVGYVLAIGITAVAMYGLTARPFGRGATLALLILAGVALAPTHELSPYLAAGALIVLALFGQAPRWAFLPIALPALGWAAFVHKAVSQNFTFGALFNLSNFRPPVTLATPGLHRLAVVGVQSHMLLLALLILITLGAIGFSSNLHAKWARAYALCPIVGLALIAINPYGNEGIFRATLFAIPWMAILAMKMPHPARMVKAFAVRGATTVGVSLCLLALLGTFLIATYSMDATNVLPRDNVATVDYLMGLPARNAFVLTLCSADNPADGVPFALNYTTLTWTQVAQGSPLQRLHPTPADARALAARYGVVASGQGATTTSPLYVVWARSSLTYCNAYGLESPAQMRAWLRLLSTSPPWRLVHRDGRTYLFRLT